MSYLELLKESTVKYSSIVCLGLDPVIEDIPLDKGTEGERIVEFYQAILDRILKEKAYPGAVKPNYAFYAQYGFSGLEALHRVIRLYRDAGFPVILDAKRGDIGKTAEAYAREVFGFFEADAVTLAPYMGYDSISPFMDGFPGRGYYVLNKTSNKSSGDIQDIDTGDGFIYERVSKKIIDWYRPGIGAVVGATFPKQLESISGIFRNAGKDVPLLIPGVGSQGGSAADVAEILSANGNYQIHRINSSSAINFAYKRFQGMSYDSAAVRALKELNDEIESGLEHGNRK
jgi:orotidine-5'-phosphate decarboxylase